MAGLNDLLCTVLVSKKARKNIPVCFFHVTVITSKKSSSGFIFNLGDLYNGRESSYFQ